MLYQPGGVKLLLLLLLLQMMLCRNAESSPRYHRQADQRANLSCFSGDPCILLDTCPSLAALLKRRPNLSRVDARKIQTAICGFGSNRQPLVCCSDRITPGATARPGSVTQRTPRPTPQRTQRPTPQRTPRPTTQPTNAVTVPTLPPSNPGNGEALLPAKCGSVGNEETRIFFGENAALGAYPWMALLGFTSRSQPDVVWACGGTLINDHYVLTAGHCTDPQFTFNRQITVVRLGENNLSTDPDCDGSNCAPPHLTFTPAGVFRHPSFTTRGTVSDDIALVRLNATVPFSRYVSPVCLPAANLDTSAFLAGRQATVAGWGVTERGPDTQILQTVKISFISRDACNPFYNNALVPEQVCFGGEGQRDSCFGDSGGPVVSTGPNNSGLYTLLAVVSFGQPTCGVPGVPAVYTNVGAYRSWILSNLQP